jgi:predicted RecA/RadA family phage recombinase
MINYLQSGDTLSLTAPYAVAAGAGLRIGFIFGIAAGAALAGALVEVKRNGVYVLPCVSADVVAAGAKVYWDDTAKTTTTTATGNILIGAATAPKTAGQIAVNVVLDAVIR